MSKLMQSRIFFLVLAGALLLPGCINRQTPAEKMFGELEKVVEIEKTFEEQQDPLVELEKKEKQIYEEIISLGLKEYDKIVSLADEALEIVDQRKKHMDKEQESIKASEKEFKQVTGIIDDIEEPGLKKQANTLYKTMSERYKIHDELYGSYTKGLEHDKQLYGMFKNKDLTMEQLETQINKVNETYEKVLKANEQFNAQTEKYNTEKLAFYKEAGLKVKSGKNK
ncbi:YkyA family protein [Bacillus sp. T33-2]|uniref:YkyA family protein n=1 Tax=Bacillus sp. T33-2 TaxID=2054168 RepID=UPI0021553FFC|nr:YkyA family protein [Bacillus sp. T33-2]